MPNFDFIHTFSGNKLTFLDPQEDQIELADVANNLSKVCRYCGNIEKFYSVAEHSVLLANKVMELTGDKHEALGALFHDASEAYLCDIPRPIKPHLKGYEEMESKIQGAIRNKFNFPEMSGLVHKLDQNIVADEAKVLFKEAPDWTEHYTPIGVDLKLLKPADAEDLFLETYYGLIYR